MLIKLISFLIVGMLTLPGFAAASGAVQLPATNQATCFDTDGNLLSSCTATGQDGEKKAGIAWPASRFTDNENGTVTDNLTGLIWSQHANAPNRALSNDPPNDCPNAETSMLWDEAIDFVACLNNNKHAGFGDWRLPNLQELESMVNSGVASSSVYLNDSGFGLPGLLNSQVQPIPYWTATSDASAVDAQSAAAAWNVDLSKGDFPSSTIKSELPRGVWPVRGASTGPAALWRTGQADCYDYLGDKHNCAGTGEDGEKLAGALWPAPRFNLKSSGNVVVDRLTRLSWTTATLTPGPGSCKIIDPNMNWQQALDHVACLNHEVYLGRSDWRLPNRKELRSLVDYSRGNPALPAGHLFDDLNGLMYWSSTTVSSAPNEAWAVSMFDGGISGVVKAGPQAGTLPVWPVSGPDLVAPTDFTITQGNMTTNVANQTISGTVEAGATVTVRVNGGVSANATVTGTTWNYIINPLAPGDNIITVTATDAADNTKALPPITITLDTTPPVTTANPDPGTYYVSVTVSLASSEKDNTIYYTTDGTPVSTNSPVYSAPIILRAAATTTYNVKFFSVDIAGNVEAPNTASYTLRVNDLIGSVKINADAQQTNMPGVTLTLAASASAGVTEMQVACDGTNYASVEPFAVAKNCTLSNGDGLKTVSVKFKDDLGNWNLPINAKITLDTAPPVTTVTPEPDSYGGKVTVALKTSEAGTIYYTTDGSVPTTSSPVYTVPFELAASTTTTFKVQYFAVDLAGNSEHVRSAVFMVNVSNFNGSIKINNGESYASSTAVTLTLSTQDTFGVTRMQFSNDGTTYTPLEPYATSKAWTLAGGDGIKTVYVRLESGTGSLFTISANINYSAAVTSVSNCDLNGDKKVDIADALKALQISIGLYSPTIDEMIRGDVAPLVNGKPAPDGKIDLADALVILRRSLGLVAW